MKVEVEVNVELWLQPGEQPPAVITDQDRYFQQDPADGVGIIPAFAALCLQGFTMVITAYDGKTEWQAQGWLNDGKRMYDIEWEKV